MFTLGLPLSFPNPQVSPRLTHCSCNSSITSEWLHSLGKVTSRNYSYIHTYRTKQAMIFRIMSDKRFLKKKKKGLLWSQPVMHKVLRRTSSCWYSLNSSTYIPHSCWLVTILTKPSYLSRQEELYFVSQQ